MLNSKSSALCTALKPAVRGASRRYKACAGVPSTTPIHLSKMSQSDFSTKIESFDSEKKPQVGHVEYRDEAEARTGGEPHFKTSKLSNPLESLSRETLLRDVNSFAEKFNLQDVVTDLEHGALIAQRPTEFEDIPDLTEDEKDALRNEKEHKWSHPFAMYATIVLCSIGACVQGWDQTGSAGANLSFPTEFGIPIDNSSSPDYNKNNWIVGLVNSAPYISAFACSVWLADPFNHVFGRRGTLFFAAIFCIAAPLGSAFTHKWWELFICRLLLGLGVGFKEVTAPVLAAENAPTIIRGALVMSWQMWTAFGIFLGYSANLIVHDVGRIAWRLQLGSALIPAVPLLALVYLVPESPRWYLKRGKIEKAWESLLKLRKHRVLAARDLYYIYVQILQEREMVGNNNVFKRVCELFYKNRLRQATLASFVVMIAQQMCGINVISFFSSSIFQEVTGNVTQSMWASWGFGLINFLFAIPAFYTIDTFGRRSLLLFTFPNMFWTLLVAGLSYLITDGDAKLGMMATFIYLFTIFYSPGEGPVPFTYSAEVFPLSHREIGMAWAVTVNNFFAAVLSLTFFRMNAAMTTTGAFGFYAGLNLVAFVWIFLWVPETKQLSLEELDDVFSIPTHTFTKYQTSVWLPWFCKRYIRFDKSAELVDLLDYAHGTRPSDLREDGRFDNNKI